MSSVTLSMDADRDDHRPRLVTYQGANDRTLTVTIMEDGSVKDLTDYTLYFTAREGGVAGYVKVGATELTVAAPTTGVATYTPNAADVDDAGEFDAQIMLDNGSSAYDYTQVFRFIVLPVIDIRINTKDGDGTEYAAP